MASEELSAWKEVINSHEVRAKKYLSILKADELDVVILRGHLVIEELLTKGIEAHCIDAYQLREAKLRFGQKVALFRALEKIPVVPSHFWEAIVKLDRLRSELSHTLSKEKIPNRAREFVKEVELFSSDTKFPSPKDGKDAVSQALHFLLGGLEIVMLWQHGVEEVVRAKLTDKND